jgi:hypothetical protein
MNRSVTTLQDEDIVKVNVVGDNVLIEFVILNALVGKTQYDWTDVKSNEIYKVVSKPRYDIMSGLDIPSLDITMNCTDSEISSMAKKRMMWSDDINIVTMHAPDHNKSIVDSQAYNEIAFMHYPNLFGLGVKVYDFENYSFEDIHKDLNMEKLCVKKDFILGCVTVGLLHHKHGIKWVFCN